MSLPLDQVKRIAHLARIAVTDAEAEAVRDDLNRIFALIEQMNAVDTAGIEPMAHARSAAELADLLARNPLTPDIFPVAQAHRHKFTATQKKDPAVIGGDCQRYDCCRSRDC